ncbi:MAG: hypothetical protein ACO24A_02760 [Burkholderiaceae bacterium]
MAHERVAAIGAAMAHRLQTSFNLAVGSALASIGITLIAGITTLATGKTAVLQGVVYLVIFIAYLFLTIVP